MRRGKLLKQDVKIHSKNLYQMVEPYLDKGNIKFIGLKLIKEYIKTLPEDEREEVLDDFVLILIREGVLCDQ